MGILLNGMKRFRKSENALGGVYFNIFRTSTFILAIVITVIFKKRMGASFEVNRKTLWLIPS